MKNNRLILGSSVLLLVALGAGADINSSVRVAAGEALEGNRSTLNGSISIGDGATIRGACKSVNGRVELGRDVRVEAVSSVNGNVSVGEGSVVEEGVEAVNGRIELERGARAARVASVNGSIKLAGADVDGDVATINGNIRLTAATVGGDVVVEDHDGRRSSRREPQVIELEDGSVVRGDIRVEDPSIEVKVYLRSGSRVEGRITNAQVIEE